MRYLFASLALAAIGAIALLPANVRAGPFKYRGGPWDRWVASGYSTPSSTYYSTPSRDDPGIPRTSQSYYYPSSSYYSGIPWVYQSPSRWDPSPQYIYPTPPVYSRQDNIPWKLTSPSRDNPE